MSEIGALEAVQTTAGRVEGLQRKGHLAFYGIPYAACPSGARRFRAPEPPEAWSGVRKAREIGFAAPQTEHRIGGFAASGPQDEDCLNLNVFTPAADDGRRPVMVWIHGGGFTHGAGYEQLYDGGPLAVRGDLVVVSLNYRLGALGFLHLPEAGFDSNVALLDQVAALRWVRDNITAFGGDPEQVTIFGESAGSASVGCLTAMPAARGLFRRAIFQSGVGRAGPPEQAASAADALLAALGLDRSRAADLAQIPTERILEGQTAAIGQGFGFGPVRDPATLPQDPLGAAQSGETASIEMLIGSNRDEVKLFAATSRRPPLDEAALLQALAAALPKASEGQLRTLAEVYRASRETKGLPAENLDILDAVNSDLRFRVPSMRLAAAQAARQPHTYLYLFTHASPARRGALGACHALEMPFVFGTLGAPTQDKFAGSGPEVQRLSYEMMDAWIGFAREVRPSHPAIGAWPTYGEAQRPTMIFDSVGSRLEKDPFSEQRRALEALL